MVNYKLDGKKIVPCESILEWAMAFESIDPHVADEKIWGLRVSTVFLGIDHGYSFIEGSEPVLFETMVFVGGRDIQMRRYCTWDEAEVGHKEIVATIKRHPWNLIALPWLRFTLMMIVLPRLQVVINKIYELRDKIKSRIQ
jgi:hypothetical protein